METQTVVVLVFVFLARTTADQQQCQTVHSVKDRALTGHVIGRLEDTSVERCHIRCEKEPNCYSVNYMFSSKSCELNQATRESHPKLFLWRDDTVYLGSLYRHYHACVHSPCQNGGTCILTSSSQAGFTCDCAQRYSGDKCENCDGEGLGMYDMTIPDSDISASTFEPDSPPFNGRIYFMGGWRPLNTDTTPYLEIHFRSIKLITGVATQGWKDKNQTLPSCWTTEFYLEYSVAGKPWQTHKEADNDRVFKGNTNANAYVKNRITHPFRCTALRIHPVTWEERAAMRTELYGCDVYT